MATARARHFSLSGERRQTSKDSIPLWAGGIPLAPDAMVRIPTRKLLGIALTILAFAFLLALTAFPVRVEGSVFASGVTAEAASD